MAILRQILMRLEAGISDRKIASDLKVVDRKTVGRYRKRLADNKVNNVSLLTEKALYELFFRKQDTVPVTPNHCRQLIVERLDYYISELKRTGVTLQLLWSEFIAGQPRELQCSYPTFCRTLKPHLRKASLSYRNAPIAPAEVMMIDFAGKKLSYTDRLSGKPVPCVLFVAVLGNSKYSFAEVLVNASTGYLIEALTGALKYFGGSPRTLLTDNMAQLVKKADRYEAKFTDAALDWANHYGIFLTATRVGSPKDKPDIERLVRITYERIYATLRNHSFDSLRELRMAVREKLEEHNNRKFSGKTYSRSEAFETDERGLLNPLPARHFELHKVTSAKVQMNYHVLLGEDKHFYSVPYKYVGRRMNLRYTTTRVEIYLQADPVAVATHLRNPRRSDYTTNPEHMPASHQAYAEARGWVGVDFIERAAVVGPNTARCIERILKSRQIEQHSYRSCQGLLCLGFSRRYGNQRLESACELACELNNASYATVKSILEKGRDLSYIRQKAPVIASEGSLPIVHENLRGKEAFDQ